MQAEISAVEIISLGCAKNFVDTEIAAASLLTQGFSLVGDERDADVKFINTCAFLAAARKELEGILKHAAGWKKKIPGRKIIVGGCIVPWDQDRIFRTAHPEVDMWCAVHAVEEIGQIARAVLDGTPCPEKTPDGYYLPTCHTPRLQLTPPHYAYLKVSDGCDNRCTYCKIPDIRGSLHSRPLADVVQEAENLLANGVKELIVIAQDTAAFGRDLTGKPCLAELLDKLDQLNGDFLIRLMYLHPASVTDELIAAMERNAHLIRCIEMPLQHIADPVLAAMHRRAGSAATKKVVAELQKRGFAIRTTFMVAFPGETEEDFAELLDYVKQTRFTRLGTFIYSRESGVPAADMPGQIAPAAAKRRLRKIMEAQAEISLRANEMLIGTEQNVILDELLPRKQAAGRLFADAPEIDNTVLIKGIDKKQHKPGDFVRILVTAASEYEIHGTLTSHNIQRSRNI